MDPTSALTSSNLFDHTVNKEYEGCDDGTLLGFELGQQLGRKVGLDVRAMPAANGDDVLGAPVGYEEVG